ncbi:YafY family protein [Streptococcus sp. sy018]|uniref:helix-turn-helix transcriptional regulator n=1 Tax=Streptococcus sp. sy018 TaxID=2600147 RepID=UPI0011B67143|nr:WYL domain-containing protein [Streptococcus sp. sy018]TWS95358.1 WYL domain-containing protein [Streptococcus sp. sy018]
MKEAERILMIFLRLQAGEYLSKSQLAREFGVSTKTIQRDFSFLENFIESQSYFSGELIYNHSNHKRQLKKASQFNKKEILVISKILLENRALNKEENNALLDGLLALLSKSDQKEIEQIIASEKLNYAPLQDQQHRIDKVWIFSEYIRQEQMIEFDYASPYSKKVKKHTVLLSSLYYDDHYFYLKGFDMEKEKYLDFRLDRVQSWQNSDVDKPKIDYRHRYKDGEHRNLKVDAFSGKPMTFTINYTIDKNIILDKFPNAKVVKEDDKGYEIVIESQNTLGLKRYIISQLDVLTVLSPQSFVDEIKDMLEKMQKNYD